MKIGIGIIGFGTVGVGTYKILREEASLIRKRSGIDIDVIRIADIDIDRDRGVPLEPGILTRDAYEVINDDNIDIVVELVGGINPALQFITTALGRKKWVVTANKALLAEHGEELFRLANTGDAEIGFEASVGGGIPVIRAIRDGLIGNRFSTVLGILNGTSNYILTGMTEEGKSFEDTLKDAQRLGYAEQDPTFDVEGIDAAHKLCVLTRLAFHCPIEMKDITIRGITKLSAIDIAFAKEFGYVIKLLAIAKQTNGLVEARVEPAMVPAKHPMSSVNGVFNAVYIIGDRTGPTLFYGRGAGSDPTGSAVVSDIVDMAQRKKGLLPRRHAESDTGRERIRSGEDSSVPYYIRINALDSPGVLSTVSGILAKYNISISAVIQKGRQESGYVPIVMVTHEAVEANLNRAKTEIDALSVTHGESVHIRIEEGSP